MTWETSFDDLSDSLKEFPLIGGGYYTMKATLNYNLRGYSGKLGDVVYSSYYNYRLCHSRIFRYPTLTDTHSRMREINNNLNALYMQASEAYRQDWKTYSLRNAMENRSRSGGINKQMPPAKALFVQCMWKWAKANPGLVDLRSVTKEHIISLDSPLRMVSSCVQCGWLKGVWGWESLNNQM